MTETAFVTTAGYGEARTLEQSHGGLESAFQAQRQTRNTGRCNSAVGSTSERQLQQLTAVVRLHQRANIFRQLL